MYWTQGLTKNGNFDRILTSQKWKLVGRSRKIVFISVICTEGGGGSIWHQVFPQLNFLKTRYFLWKSANRKENKEN